MTGPVATRRSLLLGAAAATLLPRPSHAAAPLLNASAPAWYRFKIGEFEATIVSDGPLALGKPEGAFAGAGPGELDKLLMDNFLPTDNVVLEQNALVLNTGRQLVLFDTGMGAYKMFGPTTGRLLANLKLAGFEPGQFDAVVLTHAHSDHCFGLVGEGGQPNFPNARVHVAKADFDFWTDEAKLGNATMRDFVAGARQQLLPLRDRMTFVEDGKEVVPGVTAMHTPGHTVGHMAYAISSGSKSLLLTGDLAHHQVLILQKPRLEFAYDSDPKQAVASRIRAFDMAVTNRMPVLSYHFPFPGLGHVSKAGDGFQWHPTPMQTLL
ncbi:MAG TPA: MBL fold metallo-hydrolase [Beijerinckiaceae bacterium]|jgi:glyoxylase-like metal-dependent hydrolase (beta-lactamase superfamily II)